ncbi:MAG: amino acid permease [Verrucomicrobiota bacterium]
MPSERQLGLVSATALVVASMIGTGVFTTTGLLLESLKSPARVLAVWVAGGILAALGALSYGALARRIPESGGEYLFLSRTLHPAAGYVAGWISLLVGFSAPLAAAAYAFGEYTKSWLPGWGPQLSGTVLLLIFSALHAIHVQSGAWVQNVAVFLKVALIALFVGFAFVYLPPAEVALPAPVPLSAFGPSLLFVSFCYSGWNAAVYIGGEIRDPERNLPRALLLGTGLVTLLYLALNAVFVFSAPVAELAGKVEIGRVAAQALGGSGLAEAVSASIALALVTTASSMIMAGPRVYARMAADGYLPRFLAPASGPPQAAIALQLLIALVLLWSATFETLLIYIGFTLSLSTAATVVGLVLLRRREGAQLKIPGWPWVPGLFLLGVLAMAGISVAGRPVATLLGLATIAAGWVAWRVSRPSKNAMKKLMIRITAIALLLLVAALVAVFFSLNSIVKKAVETVGPQLTKVEVRLGGVKLSPLSGRGQLNGLFVGNPTGYKTPTAIQVGEVNVSLKLGSLLSETIIVERIVIQSPEITFEGSLSGNNLSKILDNLETATAGEKAGKTDLPAQKSEKKFQVKDVLIKGGKINLSRTLLGGKALTVPLPELRLQNIGTGDQAVTAAELSRQIMKSLLTGVTKAVGEALKDVGQGVKNIGKEAGQQLDKAAKGIKNLFKK